MVCGLTSVVRGLWSEVWDFLARLFLLSQGRGRQPPPGVAPAERSQSPDGSDEQAAPGPAQHERGLSPHLTCPGPQVSEYIALIVRTLDLFA